MPRKEDAVWDRFARIYDRFMQKDRDAYQIMIDKMKEIIKPDERVLEIATGTGLIVLGLSGHVKQIDAVDFSPGMIEAAKQKARETSATNVRFGIQDACALSFPDSTFDTVIIANTLHIMPEAEKAISEIHRVLKAAGKLIAPTFVHAGSKKAAILSRVMSFTGFRAYHRWTERSYYTFLEENGFIVMDSLVLKASFPLAYVVAKQGEYNAAEN